MNQMPRNMPKYIFIDKNTMRCRWCKRIFKYDVSSEIKYLCPDCLAQKKRNIEKGRIMTEKRHGK